MREIAITEQTAGQRLDKYLQKYFNAAPKSFLYKMLRKKRIKLNGGRAQGGEILCPGDRLELYLSEETMAQFSEVKQVAVSPRHFGILYEDEEILVMNKPAGLLSQPDRPQDGGNTLVGQMLSYLVEKGDYCPQKDSTFTPAICNRLDRNTGGIVFAGKTLRAVQALNLAMAQRQVDKFYLTMVKGILEGDRTFFGYHLKNERENTVKVLKAPAPGAKRIRTKVHPLAYGKGCTLLEVELLTGKSHQIRAHLKAMGFAVAGDRKYGDPKWNRSLQAEFGLNNQFLFAYRAVLHFPEGPFQYLDQKQWTAPLPKGLEEIRKAYFGDRMRKEKNE